MNADRCTGSGYTGAVAQIFCPEIQESFYPFSYGEVFFFVTSWQGRLRLFAGRSCYVRGYCRFSGKGLLSGRELDDRPYLSFWMSIRCTRHRTGRRNVDDMCRKTVCISRMNVVGDCIGIAGDSAFRISVVMSIACICCHRDTSATGRVDDLPARCSVEEIGEFFRFIAAYPDITEIDFENGQGPEQHFHVTFAPFVKRIG